jgi:hypothetical protein
LLPLVDGAPVAPAASSSEISVLVTEASVEKEEVEGEEVEDARSGHEKDIAAVPAASEPPPPPPREPTGTAFLVAGSLVALVTALLLAAAIGSALLWKP